MKQHHSQIKCYPISWDKNLKSNLAKTWEIQYTFYCPDHPNGHPVRFKGMNRCKTLEEKQEMTRYLIDLEKEKLEKGYNPITQEFETEHYEVNEDTPFIRALNIALYKIKVSENTRLSMIDPVKLITVAANKTGKALMKISEVRKRDVRVMLDYILKQGYSNDRYNRVKANVGIIYNYFVDLEIFEHNYIHFIKKIPHTPKIRTIYRDKDKEKFEELKTSNYKLWRFLKLFYYSQSRITEFRNIKLSDVFYNKQYFIIFEKKGKRYHQVMKPINFDVSHLWNEVLLESKQGDVYLFSNKLQPGPEPCTKNSICNKYRFWVKEKLRINADMYALKHTFANDVTKQYGIYEAQKALGHTNQRTTEIYAVDYREDLLNQQKHIKTGF
jgi:site-specific recombinase XerD